MLASLLLASVAPAARGAEGDAAWLVRVWKMGDDLAGNNVTDVSESADGFLWAVAGNELVRFDGASFKHFPVPDPAGAGTLKARECTPLRDGSVAVALMDGTIARADRTQVKVLNRELNESKARVEALYEDADGSFLISTSDESVFRLRDGRITRFAADDGMPGGLHCRFVADRSGRVWFAKGTDVGLLRGEQFETLQSLPATSLRVAIAPAERGGVWIGAGTQLLHYDVGQPLEPIGDVGLKNTEVRPTALHEDHTGAVWFGTYASGLFRFDEGNCESVPISHRQVRCIAEDREGSLWIGTSGGGLDQVQPRALTIEGSEAGLPSETVQSICEDTGGSLWAVTQNGLVVTRQGGGWKAPAGLSLGNATCLVADPASGIWIGTKSGRLHRWNEGRLTTWGREDGLSGLPLNILVATKAGDIWIGETRVGGPQPGTVQRLRAGRIETLPLAPATNLIRAIAATPSGDVWIAGNSRTLWRVTPGDQIVDESACIPFPPQQIHTLCATSDGSLWVGYDWAGLGRIKNERLVRITTEQGLWDNRIELVIPDGRGWLWLAANQTIFKVSQQELTAVADGRAQQVKSICYGRDQGVRAAFGESIGALLRRDGRLWIPMATSLAIIDPEQSPPESPAPPVVITDVRAAERPLATHLGFLPAPPGVVPETAALRLAPNHRRLDIDFTALSFRTPSNVRFRYRLDGFDGSWVEAGTRRTASYPQLPAGDYTFHVKACNSEGVWNETGATLAFAVAPFFWETWWFRAAAVAAFAALVVGATRAISGRRLRQKLRAAEQETALERERARIARDIHDDLGSRLTKIVLLSGLASRERAAPEKMEQRVEEISETARQLIKSLDETVWTVNPRNDTLPHLVSYIGQFAVNLLRTAEIACELDLPVDPPPLPVSAEVRHHLLLAVKEALTNVIRHAHATRVLFRVALTASSLEVRLEDNGEGFTASPAAPEADGLHNMRQRLVQMGGRCEIESRPGAGTWVSFVLPRPAPR